MKRVALVLGLVAVLSGGSCQPGDCPLLGGCRSAAWRLTGLIPPRRHQPLQTTNDDDGSHRPDAESAENGNRILEWTTTTVLAVKVVGGSRWILSVCSPVI